MKLRNNSKNNLITNNIKVCKSIASKTFGLMFSTQKDLFFIFDKEKIISLHMFFVFYSIDVVFLDRNKRVVEFKENFKPFSVYIPEKRAMYIAELKAGAIRKSRINVGDKLSITD